MKIFSKILLAGLLALATIGTAQADYLPLPRGSAQTMSVGHAYVVTMADGSQMQYSGCREQDRCCFRCRSATGEVRDFRHFLAVAVRQSCSGRCSRVSTCGPLSSSVLLR